MYYVVVLQSFLYECFWVLEQLVHLVYLDCGHIHSAPGTICLYSGHIIVFTLHPARVLGTVLPHTVSQFSTWLAAKVKDLPLLLGILDASETLCSVLYLHVSYQTLLMLILDTPVSPQPEAIQNDMPGKQHWSPVGICKETLGPKTVHHPCLILQLERLLSVGDYGQSSA